MMMGRSSWRALAVAAGMAAGVSMAAADGPGKRAEWPNMPWTWQGLYGGVHVGSVDAFSDEGLVAGLQIGKNWQSGKLVYGLEGDLSLSGADNVDWLGTIRGRVGYLLSPSILLY